jgi:hypothetical protein
MRAGVKINYLADYKLCQNSQSLLADVSCPQQPVQKVFNYNFVPHISSCSPSAVFKGWFVIMLDMDEVLMEQAKAKAQADKENAVSILKRAPSFMLGKKQLSKNPSFFKKMFSMRNMDKVFADDDSMDDGSLLGGSQEGEGEGGEQGGDASLPTVQEAKEDADEEDGAIVKPVVEKIEMDSPYPYSDPPMPNIGRPVDMERLINRNKKAEFGLHQLMQMVTRDVDESLKNTRAIPVSSQIDRIQVTDEQSAMIGKVRTTKDIDRFVQSNFQHIQKCLNYRKSALIMMNSNYSHKLVRGIEPIYVNEARTIVQRSGDAAAPRIPKEHHHSNHHKEEHKT